MNQAFGKQSGRVLSFMLTACLLVLLSGCRNDDEKSPPEAPKKPAAQSSKQQSANQSPSGFRKESVEVLPDNTYRRKVLNEFNQEIESHTTSAKGTESVFRRGDGTVQESITKDKTGVVKSRRVFARDGKTVVAGLETRSDGTTLWSVEQKADLSVCKTTYWYDGKKPFSTESTYPDGRIELSYFRKSGTLWQKKFGKDRDKLSVEQYDNTGKLSFTTKVLPDGTTEVGRYSSNGNYTRVLYNVEKSNYGYVQWTSLKAEEFDAGGKLLRKILLDSYNQAQGTETFNADGTRTVRSIKYGYVDKEETFDKDGKSISTKEYKWDDHVNESIERSQIEKPTVEDPVYRWQNQENNPYYRYGDD